MKFFLAYLTLHAVLSFALPVWGADVGDVQLPVKSDTGALSPVWITKTPGKVIGWNDAGELVAVTVQASSSWGTLTGSPTDNADLVAALATKLSTTTAASTYQTILTTGSLALSKLATDPLARANHTGTQLLNTISNAGALAALNAVTSSTITDGTIVDADINASAAIALSKLATNPLARANHTGTQAFSTLTGTPTTLAGYGITDAITAALAASTYLPKSSPSISNQITLTGTTAPGSNPPPGSVFIYVDTSDNTLRVRGSNGTITILANP